MEIIYNNKGIIAGTVVFLAALWLHNLLVGGATLPAPGAPAAIPVDNELVNIANELSNIDFDKTLFNTAGYRSLSDWSVPLPQEPAGRTNPFDSL